MKTRFKIISMLISIVFIIAAGYIYYLLNNLPEYYYTQFTSMGITGLMYGLIITGSAGITYNLITIGSFYRNGGEAHTQVRNQIINLIKRNRNNKLEAEFNKVLNKTEANSTKVDNLLKLMCDYLGATHGVVYKVDKNLHEPIMLTKISLSNITTHPIEYRISENSIAINQMESKEKNNTHKFVILPLKKDENITGILEFVFTKEMDENSTRLLNNLSDKIGQLIL